MRVHFARQRQGEVLPVSVERARYNGMAAGLEHVVDTSSEPPRQEDMLDHFKTENDGKTPEAPRQIFVACASLQVEVRVGLVGNSNSLFGGINTRHLPAAL